MRVILWTPSGDLAAIRAFIEQDSPHYAAIVVSRLIAGTDRLASFPQSGRAVPEFENPLVREVVIRPYRIVYRLVGSFTSAWNTRLARRRRSAEQGRRLGASCTQSDGPCCLLLVVNRDAIGVLPLGIRAGGGDR